MCVQQTCLAAAGRHELARGMHNARVNSTVHECEVPQASRSAERILLSTAPPQEATEASSLSAHSRRKRKLARRGSPAPAHVAHTTSAACEGEAGARSQAWINTLVQLPGAVLPRLQQPRLCSAYASTKTSRCAAPHHTLASPHAAKQASSRGATQLTCRISRSNNVPVLRHQLSRSNNAARKG